MSAGTLVLPLEAQAHVKWFCAYDVAQQPMDIGTFLNTSFLLMVLLSLAGLLVGTTVDRTRAGAMAMRLLDFGCGLVRERSDALMRACYGAFFASLFTLGNIILTPELTTQAGWIKWLQVAIAFGLLFRGTMVLSALGMVVLFATGLRDYGLFHMMDYPIFLGSAAYFGMVGIGEKHFAIRPLDVIRWGAAITLMWASVEKWAYPDWTYPLLLTHTKMAMGMQPHFFMESAGLVEFGLAFAMLCPPLVRRSSAIILAALFISAVFEFGKIDAIGHLPIVVILFVVAADNHRPARRTTLALVPAAYTGALLATLMLYYGVHKLLFGGALT